MFLTGSCFGFSYNRARRAIIMEIIATFAEYRVEVFLIFQAGEVNHDLQLLFIIIIIIFEQQFLLQFLIQAINFLIQAIC